MCNVLMKCVAAWVLAAGLLAGCDDTPAVSGPRQAGSATPSAKRADDSWLAGQYKVQRGTSPDFAVAMLLELKGDHTLSFSRTVTLRGQTGQAKRATGTWSLDGQTLTVRLEQSEDGTPIPERERSLVLKVSQDGSRLADQKDPAAAPFVKQ